MALGYEFLTGAIAPMFTPFNEDDTIDLTGISEMIRWLGRKGHVRTVFIRSGIGRMHTFLASEVKLFAEVALKTARSETKMGVIVGCSGEFDWDPRHRPEPSRYISQGIEIMEYVKGLGADGAVLIVPKALVPEPGESHEDMIVRYYERMAKAVQIPIILYQPHGVEEEYRITPQVLSRLMEIENIVGFKLSTSSRDIFAPIAEVASRRPDFSLIAGDERFYLEALKLGAKGVIGEGCNIYPHLLELIRKSFLNGDMERAAKLQEAVHSILSVGEGMDRTVLWKQYLARKGVRIKPYNRSGTRPYPPEVVEEFERKVDEILLLSSESAS
jgi:4-hydroxy-tetrahydrodipicolinate synthase